jgi:hypothetical protein
MSSTACFGRFEVTRTLYDFNSNVDPNKWIRWFAFVILSIPYGFAVLLDGILLNSIEFWTGVNPAIDSSTRTVVGPDGEVALMTLQEDRSIHVVMTRPGAESKFVKLVRDENSVSAYDENGELISRAADVGGIPQLVSSR